MVATSTATSGEYTAMGNWWLLTHPVDGRTQFLLSCGTKALSYLMTVGQKSPDIGTSP